LRSCLSKPTYYNMIRTAGPRARFIVIAVFVLTAFSFLILGPYKLSSGHLSTARHAGQQQSPSSDALLTGHAIAPRLGNATVKYDAQDVQVDV
jgi:FAD-linked sulfhydryl oxidase